MFLRRSRYGTKWLLDPNITSLWDELIKLPSTPSDLELRRIRDQIDQHADKDGEMRIRMSEGVEVTVEYMWCNATIPALDGYVSSETASEAVNGALNAEKMPTYTALALTYDEFEIAFMPVALLQYEGMAIPFVLAKRLGGNPCEFLILFCPSCLEMEMEDDQNVALADNRTYARFVDDRKMSLAGIAIDWPSKGPTITARLTRSVKKPLQIHFAARSEGRFCALKHKGPQLWVS